MQTWFGSGRRAVVLLALAVAGLAGGLWARLAGADQLGDRVLTLTVAAGLVPLAVSVARALVRREPGVDVIALLAMAGALALGEVLAGAVIAVMLASGRLLETYAGGRARRELRALLERAPRVVHRYQDGGLASPPLEEVRPGDRLLVKPGEVVPVDGLVQGPSAVLDESALTGEARAGRTPRRRPGPQRGRQRRVPVRPARDDHGRDQHLCRHPAAGRAGPGVRRRRSCGWPTATRSPSSPSRWLWPASPGWCRGSPVRALAVLVVATPCPLILAAPVAIVAGISRAARRGIVVKGGGALERLAAGRVLLFDKTGTLTAGTPEVAEVEAHAGDGDELLRLAASLDQVSPARACRRDRAGGRRARSPPGLPGRGGGGARAGDHAAGSVDRCVAVGRAAWAAEGRPLPAWARRLRRRGALEGFCYRVRRGRRRAGRRAGRPTTRSVPTPPAPCASCAAPGCSGLSW